MPVVQLTADHQRRKARQALLFGPPDSGKTRSIVFTAPYPLALFSPPGEEGYGTIPLDVPGLTAYVWTEPAGDAQSASSMRTEYETLVYQTIAGKHGPKPKTLAIDGLHQQYKLYLNIVTGGAYGLGEEFEPRLYARAHELALSFLRRILASDIEHIIVTTWNAKEADEVGSKSAHEYADLPGRMAKLVGGLFSNKIFSKAKLPTTPTGKVEWSWSLLPDPTVWGANVKVDSRLIERLPKTVPQDWRKLFALYDQLHAEIQAKQPA